MSSSILARKDGFGLTFSSSSFFSVRLRRFRAVSSRFNAISISVSGFFFREFAGSTTWNG